MFTNTRYTNSTRVLWATKYPRTDNIDIGYDNNTKQTLTKNTKVFTETKRPTNTYEFLSPYLELIEFQK